MLKHTDRILLAQNDQFRLPLPPEAICTFPIEDVRQQYEEQGVFPQQVLDVYDPVQMEIHTLRQRLVSSILQQVFDGTLMPNKKCIETGVLLDLNAGAHGEMIHTFLKGISTAFRHNWFQMVHSFEEWDIHRSEHPTDYLLSKGLESLKDFPKSSVDVVVARNFYAAQNRAFPGLQETIDILKPGGYLVHVHDHTPRLSVLENELKLQGRNEYNHIAAVAVGSDESSVVYHPVGFKNSIHGDWLGFIDVLKQTVGRVFQNKFSIVLNDLVLVEASNRQCNDPSYTFYGGSIYPPLTTGGPTLHAHLLVAQKK